MEKRVIFAGFLILMLTLGFASAQDELEDATDEPITTSPEQAGYDWLVDEAANGNYGSDVATTALAGLALSKVGYDSSARLSADWILTQKDSQNCFPVGDCRVKDTALVLMLLNGLIMPEAEAVQTWLEGAQVASTTAGKWLIEISTEGSGDCKISYERKNQTFEQTIKVEAGKFPGCSNSNFLDIETCYQSGLLRSSPGMTFTVDCSALTDTPIITLVYSSDNKYYIINTAFGAVADLRVTNGCYSRTATGPCNKEASLYAAWALNRVGSSSNVNLYLTENYDSTSILNNALLYLSFLTKNEKYIDAIKSRQSADGSFNKNFYDTGLALLALDESELYPEKVETAKSWLTSKQDTDGSWGNNAKDTAMILYSAFGNAALTPETVKDFDPDADAKICNFDYLCDEDLGETADSCIDCSVFRTSTVCNSDNTCDTTDGETADSCTDCYCGDDICDDSEDYYSCSDDCEKEEEEEEIASECGDGFCDFDEDAETCPDDCEEGGGIGFGTIMVIILIVALVGIGGYLAYNKFKKPAGGQAKQSPFRARTGSTFGRTLPQQPTARPAAKTSDSELKKSLEEARKLLRK
ncbi:MAG: hypothetical protein V1914_03915 [archaeon]